MITMNVYAKENTAPVIVEAEAVAGLQKLARIFCGDIEKVTGHQPECIEGWQENASDHILVATCDRSKILAELEAQKKVDLSQIRGKKEVYGIFCLENVPEQGKNVLVIAGSDKRGAAYGMFYISQKMGVSPWVFWADAVPKKKEEIVFDQKIETISKEPSVRYRGFFINDEQPCFGNWAKEKFGSSKPTPELYEHIFELLLRLKGNYIWPAMWRSDFSMDHFENALLADEMGVIVGASHHEPCCRSGGEFQTLRKTHPEYGTEWSFLSNAEGISKFWRDGLLRNKDCESLITIGMRGEFDSYLMPEDATLEDNINVLKAAITEQKKLIAECVEAKHPQLLAIYKEVEDYYQGDENTPGLKDWDVIRDDIMMLCDDNFGHVRTLPNEEERKHPGGFGMYYHFDYYGGPVSYLWINSTPLAKIWEQMTMCYEYGVRDAWIVNVGDIKNQELPLSYFLDLAYDFDSWGSAAPNTTLHYTKQWLQNLGFIEEKYEGLEQVVEEYTRWNGMCRPEVLKADTYHAVHYNEAARMIERTGRAEKIVTELRGKLAGDPLADCFYELIYYPVMASANILKMNLYAGLNQFYVKQRKKLGNRFAPKVQECIDKDKKLTEEYHTLLGGKWNHMQSVFHVGYIGWNDEEWQYPDCHILHPVNAPRLLVSISDEEKTTGGNPWRRTTLPINLVSPIAASKCIDVANGGEGELFFRIRWSDPRIQIIQIGAQIDTKKVGENTYEIAAKTEDILQFQVSYQPNDAEFETFDTSIYIYADNAEETAELSENNTQETRVDIAVHAECLNLSDVKPDTLIENDGCICVEAMDYAEAKKTEEAHWQHIYGYGKTIGSLKVTPSTATFEKAEEAPSVTYRIYAKTAGKYEMELFTAPNNPVVYQGKMCVAYKVNNAETEELNTIPNEGFVPWLSHSWERGVLDQIHKAACTVELQEGENEVTIFALDPAVVLEKVVFTKEGCEKKKSYLGPVESYRVG